MKNGVFVLIVDPQHDFVDGSLAVPGADKALGWLASFLRDEQARIGGIVVTMDQHTMDHCSFQEQGGLWPAHCVRYTVGAAIYNPLAIVLAELNRRGIPIHYLEKATTSQADEYSAFDKDVPDYLRAADLICVAGLAGDFCVKQTVEDLKKHGLGDQIRMLEQGIAYINK
ncbi:MAG: isochorismatase family protein [Porphyromonas sp.]|nr:isochorismatase family protein [Porphyromonas sp.]